MATSVVRFAKDFTKEAAYDQAANAMGGNKSTGKPTWGGAGYDVCKGIATKGSGKASRYNHNNRPTLGQMQANRRLQEQQLKQEKYLGLQNARQALDQMNRMDVSRVAYRYTEDNEVYQECCSVAIPAPQQQAFMTGLEKMVFGANE